MTLRCQYDASPDDALSAIGEFAELKSPWLMGHARGVAELAADAGQSGGLPQADVSSLRRAATRARRHDFRCAIALASARNLAMARLPFIAKQ